MTGSNKTLKGTLVLATAALNLVFLPACDSGKKKDKTNNAAANATGTKDTAKPQSPTINPVCLTEDGATDGAADDGGASQIQTTSDPSKDSEPSVGQTSPQCAPSTKPEPTGTPGTGAPTSPGTGGTPSTSDGNPWTPGPGLTGCYDQGKIWLAVNKANSGKSGSCGESLANFCCTQSGILEKFPSYKSKLDPEFSKLSGEGLILYGCSTDGTGKTTLHFAAINQTVVYKSIWLGEKSEAGKPPESCPRVKLEDLGYKTPQSPAGTSTGTNTSTGTGTAVATSTGTSTSAGTGTGTGTGTAP